MHNRPHPNLLPVAAQVLLWGVLGTAGAQTVPNAGQLLEESRRIPPTLPAPAPQRLVEPPQRPSISMSAGVTVQVGGWTSRASTKPLPR